MDALKAEIASKRKAVEADSIARPTKYMRRGELERLREEQEQKARGDKKAEEEVVAKERITTRVSFSTYTRMYNLDIRMENSYLPHLLERLNPRNH